MKWPGGETHRAEAAASLARYSFFSAAKEGRWWGSGGRGDAFGAEAECERGDSNPHGFTH